jgi:CRISPR-associated exonuclease Cas4
VTPIENPKSQIANPDEREALPLSLLNDYLYCPRRAALKGIEGMRSGNKFTVLGNIAHEHADFPGFEHRAGWKLIRALPLFSERLGLSGKADLVEVREQAGRIVEARPVEYKRGRVSRWDNDRVQLCAQALCLEEMLGIAVPEGMIFHAKSQKRTTVSFDVELHHTTEEAVAQLRDLLAAGVVPVATLKPQCDGCSLHEVCLPELATSGLTRAYKNLFT